MSRSLAELETAMTQERAAKADAEREIAELHDRRKRVLLSGDIDAIEEIDRQIRRHNIEIEIADARARELLGPIYVAKEEAKKWAGVDLPSDAELAKLLDIVVAAYPDDFEHRPKEFKRAMLAVGRLGRLSEPSNDRYFVSMLDDANEILRARRLESINGDMFSAAILAWADVPWREADTSVGQQLEIGLAKIHQGTPARPVWRDLLSGKANLVAPLPPRGMGSSAAYPTPNVKIYREGSDGQMRESDPIAPLWVQ